MEKYVRMSSELKRDVWGANLERQLGMHNLHNIDLSHMSLSYDRCRSANFNLFTVFILLSTAFAFIAASRCSVS